ncbi:uncharacterized protein RSE6_07476 [Rhynchosporium secalis]|uniref:Uncharacterized protein n=1 Tax=Rhynchosporium secalis TaxID=38038 RepID=A0A1E1MCY3_RHYSE|nr:uncharacterized protein RSE6_07476 [Rhynchosporium secalis]
MGCGTHYERFVEILDDEDSSQDHDIGNDSAGGSNSSNKRKRTIIKPGLKLAFSRITLTRQARMHPGEYWLVRRKRHARDEQFTEQAERRGPESMLELFLRGSLKDNENEGSYDDENSSYSYLKEHKRQRNHQQSSLHL